MSLKEGLIYGDIFEPNGFPPGLYLYNPVNEKEGISMREDF
jgi:hypothetical protein